MSQVFLCFLLGSGQQNKPETVALDNTDVTAVLVATERKTERAYHEQRPALVSESDRWDQNEPKPRESSDVDPLNGKHGRRRLEGQAGRNNSSAETTETDGGTCVCIKRGTKK